MRLIVTWMKDFAHDIRHALRALRTRPAFAAAVIFTLALGVGASTAIFSVVNGVVLRPLAFPNEDRLITLCEQFPGSSPDWCSIAPPTLTDIADRSRTIEAIGFGRAWESHMTTPSGHVAVRSGIATPALFRALGARVARGRMIDSTDMLGRESDVALLTYEMWHARFNADPEIVGRVISLNNHAVTVVGVLERGFHLPLFEQVELWRPVHVMPRDERHREWRGFVAYGLLTAGTSLDQARADLSDISATLRQEHFRTIPDWGVTVMPMRDLIVRGIRPTLLLFLGAVALVLLIACANVSNLMLVRSTARAREMALRSALGAGRGRIVRALLTESFVIATIGAAVGLAIAEGAIRAFRVLAPAGIPRVSEVTVDGRVLAYASALVAITTLIVGLVPAMRASRVDLAQSLREGGRAASGSSSRLSTALVVVEMAMAVILVASAGTLGRSFAAFRAWSPGFERDHVALFSLSPPPARYDTKEKLGALWDRVETELSAIPGVSAVGTASAGPLFGGRETWEMELQGYPPDRRPSIRWYDVSPGYFTAVGVPLVAGRSLDGRDRPGSPFAILANETLARRFWPNESALGKRLTFIRGTDRAEFTIVGVVADVTPLRPGTAVEPEIYWSNRQFPRPYTWVWVRTTVPPATVAAALRATVKRIDADLDAPTIRMLPEVLSRQLASPRFASTLFVSFGVVALLLAAIGIYGLLAYMVALRRREIGIRLAIGAQRATVVRGVLTRGLGMALVGLGAGLAVFIAFGATLASFAPGVPARDPWTLALTGTLLSLVAAAACIVPALKAGRVDPVITLGAE